MTAPARSPWRDRRLQGLGDEGGGGARPAPLLGPVPPHDQWNGE
jgi:hypothetical protein